MIPKPIQDFVESFSNIPSIGPRKARRLSFYISNLSKEEFQDINKALSNLQKLDQCPRCFFIKRKEKDFCRICSRGDRNQNVVAIVEKETDVLSIEQTKSFDGTYLVIGKSKGSGSLTEKQKSRLAKLKKRGKKGSDELEEIIIATSPNAQGDFIAQVVKKEFKDIAQKITRLGRGLPTGGEVEFADRETLSQAIEKRS